MRQLMGSSDKHPSNWSARPAVLALAAVVVVLAAAAPAQAYIGPGAGFAVGGSLLVFAAAAFSGFVAILTWPIRYIIRSIRMRHVMKHARVKRVIVLGLDGMDPNIAEKYLAEGKLPNLAHLAESGTFKRLQTTVPSISPVAWSTFQTGVNPGKHNIFDFLTRDKRTYAPKLSSVEIRGPSRTIKLGKYVLPLGKADVRGLRGGKPFWKTLGEHGLFSSVLRVPITFPPDTFRGVQLSGMCVPDLRGSQGMFSFYTTAAAADAEIEGEESTGGQCIQLQRDGDTIAAELIGAPNPLRSDERDLTCGFTVTVRDETTADLKLNGDTHRLTKG
ncbi:MAG: alkaline phosphatase family protein, partial [Planctomycetota bacterium]